MILFSIQRRIPSDYQSKRKRNRKRAEERTKEEGETLACLLAMMHGMMAGLDRDAFFLRALWDRRSSRLRSVSLSVITETRELIFAFFLEGYERHMKRR